MFSVLGAEHENQVLYFDPGCATLNVGDEIISDSARAYLDPLFSDKFVVRLSTHQRTSFRYRRYLRKSFAGFVLGSNLLKANMLFGFRQWDISLVDAIQIRDLVLVGCGWQNYGKRVDLYSRALYGMILSKGIQHSVRDEYTKMKLHSIGVRNVINTGCPTMWKLTPEFCARIRKEPASRVVTTVTDYRRDPQKDGFMFEQLLETHKKVYVWLQGNGDWEYLKKLSLVDRCAVVPPSLQAYDELLESTDDIEYVGTRLHGGIRALQHGRRSLIVSIDNRAREMSKDYNLPVLERDEISTLREKVDCCRETRIKIDTRGIERFLSQFR